MGNEVDFETIRYERPAENVARIMLSRPEVRNAQNTQMLSSGSRWPAGADGFRAQVL